MGNTPVGGSKNVSLGNGASMEVSRVEGMTYSNGECYYYERQNLSCCVDDRTCKASIRMIKKPGSNRAERFIISIVDSDKLNVLSWRLWPYRFEMMVGTEEEQQLKVCYAKTDIVQDDLLWSFVVPVWMKGGGKPPSNLYEDDATSHATKTTDPDGTITETSINLYTVRGRDTQKGLVVIECKKRSLDQNPFAVVVSHYFASSRKTSLGFSMVARIRGENGGVLQVEGPVLHPANALFEMFDKVSKTKRWTPALCSHCGGGGGGGVLSNSGIFYGNGNGCYNITVNNNVSDDRGQAKSNQRPQFVAQDEAIPMPLPRSDKNRLVKDMGLFHDGKNWPNGRESAFIDREPNQRQLKMPHKSGVDSDSDIGPKGTSFMSQLSSDARKPKWWPLDASGD
ncbi:hypothetical protein E2542_SST27437 [Spatholobus suberectus]|nr:hypothetical protein E2542_SST27437 [Spatholobus suberectus]